MKKPITLTPDEAARILSSMAGRPSVVMRPEDEIALRMGAELCSREARRETTVRGPR